MLSQDRTSIIVADRILVMQNHHIVEDGTPRDLIAAGKYYARMYAMTEDSAARHGIYLT